MFFIQLNIERTGMYVIRGYLNADENPMLISTYEIPKLSSLEVTLTEESQEYLRELFAHITDHGKRQLSLPLRRSGSDILLKIFVAGNGRSVKLHERMSHGVLQVLSEARKKSDSIPLGSALIGCYLEFRVRFKQFTFNGTQGLKIVLDSFDMPYKN